MTKKKLFGKKAEEMLSFIFCDSNFEEPPLMIFFFFLISFMEIYFSIRLPRILRRIKFDKR